MQVFGSGDEDILGMRFAIARLLTRASTRSATLRSGCCIKGTTSRNWRAGHSGLRKKETGRQRTFAFRLSSARRKRAYGWPCEVKGNGFAWRPSPVHSDVGAPGRAWQVFLLAVG